MSGLPPDEYEAMWKLASEFVDAILERPDIPSGEDGRAEPVASTPPDDASE